MASEPCAQCGWTNSEELKYCVGCGVYRSNGIDPPRSAVTPAQMGVDHDGSPQLMIGTSRVLILSVLVSGPYLMYWMYVTWKQLQRETNDVHYPLWHALTMLVPVYGLFRLYRHMNVINGLALRAGLPTFSPGMAVVLISLNMLLGFSSTGTVNGLLVLVLKVISVSLVATNVVWGQSALNAYWSHARGVDVDHLPIGRIEIGLAVIGAIIWLNLLSSVI